MQTYLYAVLPAGSNAPPAGLGGVGAGEVRALGAGGLTLWVSDVEECPRASVAGARAHDRVVAAALATGDTPLPARFGQCHPDDSACVAEVGREEGRLRERLRSVAGAVEMRLVVRLPSDVQAEAGGARAAGNAGEADRAAGGRMADSGEIEPSAGDLGTPNPGPGRAYMARLQADLGLARNLRETGLVVRRRITETVGAFVREEAVLLAPAPSTTLTLSHLIDRSAEADYRAAIAGARTLLRDCKPMVFGPLAPYSFSAVR
jgi:hypothetical protein